VQRGEVYEEGARMLDFEEGDSRRIEGVEMMHTLIEM
jgi:hypothetical protein